MVYKEKKWRFRGKYKTPAGAWKNYDRGSWKTKKEAMEAEKEFLATVTKLHDITLNEVYAQMEAHSMTRESTIIGDRSYYDTHIREPLGNKKVCDIKIADVELWKKDMLTKTKLVHGKPAGTYSIATVKHAKNVLSKTMNFAVRMGYAASNPCSMVTVRSDSAAVKTKPLNFWEPDEFQRFMQEVDDQEWIDCFNVLYKTGMREGELMALKWSAVDFTRHCINVRESVTAKTKQSAYAITAPKNANSVRRIDMQHSLESLLADRLEREKLADGFSLDYFVFGRIRPMPRSTLARYLDMYIARSGVKRITPHGFRHSHASDLISKKVDDTLIAERLGHTVAELRKTYAHVYKNARRDLRDVLD